MPRKLRLEFPGACYHVINRGNYRQPLFDEDSTAESFENCLFEAATKFDWRLHAYVIMRNHFHIAVETPEPNLSLGMKFLQGTWANRFNRFYSERGRPFQGRYKALHVEPGQSFAKVCHYIHLNPVRAKIVPSDSLFDFRWSSLWWLRQAQRHASLAPETVLSQAGDLPDDAEGWERYREYLSTLAENAPGERSRRFEDLTRGWAIGSSAFRAQLLQNVQSGAGLLTKAASYGEARGERLQLRADYWELALRKAAESAQISLTTLGPKKSSPEKVLLAGVMKAATDVSNSWLCERLGMGTPASVSQFVRRFRLAGGDRNPVFESYVSRVKM